MTTRRLPRVATLQPGRRTPLVRFNIRAPQTDCRFDLSGIIIASRRPSPGGVADDHPHPLRSSTPEANMLPSFIRISSLAAALFLAPGLSVGPAVAQDVFGMLEAHAAMSAQAQYAADRHAAYSNRYDDDRPSRAPSRPGLTREELERLEAQAREQQIEADARYQRWLDGSWDFFQSREPAGPGEICTAMYQSPKGMIALSGFDKSWDGALLMFTGDDIPKPRSFREVKATLTQTGDPPATVQVYNYARDPRMNTLGTLVFAVPTMEAALAGMTEEQEFAISIRGKEVFRMGWKDGVKAAQELRKCVRNR